MNRIILIGNGFDLAHNLNTKYGHFIDDFWKRQAEEIKTSEDWKNQEREEEKKVESRNKLTKTIYFENNYFKLKFKKTFKWYDLRNKVEYKNKFLEEINNAQKIENWLDIEKMYFKELKRCKNIFKECEFINPEKAIEPIKKLNSDFEEITKELENYLIEEMRNKSLLKDGSVNFEYEEKLQAAFKEIIFEGRGKDKKEECDNILLLNFNYTNTEELYKTYKSYSIEKENLKIIHIHGKLDDTKNKMIFGYGDEKSEESKEIENLDDNRFLTNVKSVRYTETNNYNELRDFINEPYEVFILGHNCGNSDRTLLKMLFEGDECKEIRVYYYFDLKKKWDNFDEIRNNIYRNFDDKGLFRNRLIDKQKSDKIPNKDLLDNKTILDLFIEENLVMIEVPNKDFKYTLLDDKINTEYVLNNYFIGKYQVTQELWESVMGNNPSYFKGENFPVEEVSWYDIVEFCNKLTELLNKELEDKDKKTNYYNIEKDKNGKIIKVEPLQNANGFRLPTNAEWEYAVRGGVKSKKYEYAGCNTEEELKDYAWYSVNSENTTNPVGQLKANELELYDMSGNVWELCDDCYDNNCTRVLRGGCWGSNALNCRVLSHYDRPPDNRHNDIGFRLACYP